MERAAELAATVGDLGGKAGRRRWRRDRRALPLVPPPVRKLSD
jgi:hypothetical protein